MLIVICFLLIWFDYFGLGVDAGGLFVLVWLGCDCWLLVLLVVSGLIFCMIDFGLVLLV